MNKMIAVRLCVYATFLLATFGAVPAFAKYAERTLYTFCSETNCTDGNNPIGALLMDQDGSLYGTTASGGAYSVNVNQPGGTVFVLTNRGGQWTHKILYSFCKTFTCESGATPLGGLIMDVAGNLYGTARNGGSHSSGTVFELVRHHNHWNFQTLYNFGDTDSGGGNPGGALVYAGQAEGNLYDGASPLFGTALSGAQGGVVFELSKTSQGWQEDVIRELGSTPSGGLIFDSAGHLYGTTLLGGTYQNGVTFELAEREGKNQWSEQDLHSFSSCCGDGFEPTGAIALDASGTLYGATEFGGVSEQHGGVIYAITLNKDGGKAKETILYSYCIQRNCRDGSMPYGGVSLDVSGNVLSIAETGGHQGVGSLLKLSSTGEILDQYSFCSRLNCADGSSPVATVISVPSGNLFGAAESGGSHGDDHGNGGTVFELIP